jgi:hypothetical protein
LNNGKDPLFNDATEGKFRSLQQTIVRWEQDTEANRVETHHIET